MIKFFFPINEQNNEYNNNIMNNNNNNKYDPNILYFKNNNKMTLKNKITEIQQNCNNKSKKSLK